MIPKPPQHVCTIDRAETLRAFVARMAAREWIAVDTEFWRQRTYYPELCLVQIADAEEIGLIDVLAIDDLCALAGLLANRSVTKVLHSAEQDLEVLYQRFGRVPAPVFDTQIAAALAGYDAQMGYARLIAAMLGVTLPKAHTRTDWRRRPFTPGVLDYAADDVRYLAVAYRVLQADLETRGRSTWPAEDFQRLVDPQRFTANPATAWRRLRNWHGLPAEQQQVLAALAEWREREAIAANRPRGWILGDDAVIAIAKHRPADRSALADIAAVPAKTVTRDGPALLASVRQARQAPPTALAARPPAPDAREKTLIKTGMARLRACAEAAGIAAALLASRNDIARLVAGDRDIRLLRGWRARVAGEAVLAAVESARAPTLRPQSHD